MSVRLRWMAGVTGLVIILLVGLSFFPLTSGVVCISYQRYSGMPELAEDSSLIVKGKVVGSENHFQNWMVYTDKVLEIEKVYRGSAQKGDRILLGTLKGTGIGIKQEPFYDYPESGEYVLFLTTDPLFGTEVYAPTGGFQGIYILAEGQVKNAVASDRPGFNIFDLESKLKGE